MNLEPEMEKTADEVKRLQSCINDLISVLALAAIWSGSESRETLGTLLDSLLAILRLDFACARVNHSIDGSPIEVMRLAQRQHSVAHQQGRVLARWPQHARVLAEESPRAVSPGAGRLDRLGRP